jgi:hypothetical protein
MKKKIIITTQTGSMFIFTANVEDIIKDMWDSYNYTLTNDQLNKESLTLDIGGDIIEIINEAV